MTHQVATGYSEVLPDLDFETYSEAGYIWVEGKLQSTLGKGKKGGLPAVGSLLYSLHPSTEVLCMAYDLKDGLGKRLWHPELPVPLDLFTHVTSKGLIESWNTTFEHHIWNNVCVSKYGFPPLHYTQQRDAMAKARAFSLPAKLSKAALVLGTAQQKDKEGTRLLNKFSKPRNPTAKDKRTRILPEPTDPDTQLLYDYCIQDIATEEDISAHIPDLIPDELEFWLNTCKSNYQGVGINPLEIEACIAILEQAYTKYNLELANITEGQVMEATKVAQLLEWCGSQGVYTATLDDDATKALLGQEIPSNVRRALEIRQMIGSAGVKKVYTMKKIASPQGRLCDLFIYHGARTGRDTGAEVQPQNLTKAGPKITWCSECKKPFGRHWVEVCPHCNASVALFGTPAEWSWEAVDHAIEVIRTKSLDYVEWIYGNAILTISGCIRGLFVAGEGKEFICSDYSAIEAVVLAALAGEQWRLDTFHAKEDIYLKSASTITGTTMAEYKQYAIDNGSKHPDRQKIGKVAELACFGADTEVLTSFGWKRIVTLTPGDRIFDGLDFVASDGIISRGIRETVTFEGVRVTLNHKFFTGGNTWVTTEDLLEQSNCLTSAKYAANLLLLNTYTEYPGDFHPLDALVLAEMKQALQQVIFYEEKVRGAIPALRRQLIRLRQFMGGNALIASIGGDCLTVSPQRSDDALMRLTQRIKSTVGGELEFSPIGYSTENYGWNTYVPSKGGITQKLLSTVKIMTLGMKRVTSGLFRIGNNKATNGKPCGSNTLGRKCRLLSFIGGMRPIFPILTPWQIESKGVSPLKKLYSTQAIEVFDIINCGPRSRFMIRTSRGVLIAHNSGYAGWVGAWKNFGADKFYDDAKIKELIVAWRDASPTIVEFWGGQVRGKPWNPSYHEYYGLEGAAIQAVLNVGQCYSTHGITFGVKDDALFMRLPSGRNLTYHRPRLTPSSKYEGQLELSYEGWNSNPQMGPIGWFRMGTYGGKICENIIQSVSRDIMAFAVNNLERAGYDIVIRVHDEIVAEIPQGSGNIEEFERIMATLPKWAEGWPIRASGGWIGQRYRKD